MNFLNKRILAALLFLAVMLPFRNLAADHVTMTLQNPTSTANTLEFDVYIVNDGTSVLNLGGYQFGINFSNTILNGGTPAANGAYTYIAGTRDAAFASLSAPSIAYTASTSHLRVVSTTVASVYAGNLPMGVPKCLGRYRFTNTVNWLAASNPNLQFQLVTAGGKTQCIAACFIGSSNSSTALTNPLGTLSGTVIAPGFLLNVPLPVHISSFNGKKSG
ncbi:hypothetical protein EMGBS15_10700 [Filimonas sp.]|nr:hypothetical protein EMGBS15_10700 [Filimonas sp.]